MGTAELESKTLVLLAGGKASRLNSFLNSENRVKCLTEFEGRIFLDYLLTQAQDAGIKNVIILGGPDRERIEHAVSELNYSMSFSFPVENERRGTGGSLALLAPYLRESHFILSNADTYFAENPFELLKSLKIQDHLALFLMRNQSKDHHFSKVSLQMSGSWPDLYQTDTFTYTGLSILNSEIIFNWNNFGLPTTCSFEKDVFGKIKNRSNFISYPFAEIDFGTEAGFKRMQQIFKREAV